MTFKFFFRLAVVAIVAFVAYDYYNVRQEALCAHAAIASGAHR